MITKVQTSLVVGREAFKVRIDSTESLLFPDEPRQVHIDAELTEVSCLKFIEWSILMPYDLDFVLKFLGTLRRGHL